MRIGVLAMQGAFQEHLEMLSGLEADAVEVRKASDLENIDGLIIPGGESTAIGKLLDIFGIKSKLKERIINGLPVWGTCAGMIILAKRISGGEKSHLPLMDVEVTRNGYGRQLGSFEASQRIRGIEDGSFPMIFIRAPYISGIGEDVEILSEIDGRIVAARQKNILATSFHPELTNDPRMHRYFLQMVSGQPGEVSLQRHESRSQ